MPFSLTWLHHRRGAATVGIAALLTCGIGLAPAFSSTPAPKRVALDVFSGCLATHGDRQVFNVVMGPARRKACPAGSTRVHWNAEGRSGAGGAAGAPGTAGANGVNGAPGTVGATGLTGTAGAPGTSGVDGASGADGSIGLTGSAGADGTSGLDGAAGPAGPGSLVSGGVFTLLSPGSYPDTHAYLPLSGYLANEFVAPPLDQDSEFTWAAHTSVEQVIDHVRLHGAERNWNELRDAAFVAAAVPSDENLATLRELAAKAFKALR